MVLSGWAARR